MKNDSTALSDFVIAGLSDLKLQALSVLLAGTDLDRFPGLSEDERLALRIDAERVGERLLRLGLGMAEQREFWSRVLSARDFEIIYEREPARTLSRNQARRIGALAHELAELLQGASMEVIDAFDEASVRPGYLFALRHRLVVDLTELSDYSWRAEVELEGQSRKRPVAPFVIRAIAAWCSETGRTVTASVKGDFYQLCELSLGLLGIESVEWSVRKFCESAARGTNG